MTEPNKPFFAKAVDALKAGDRRGGAALLQEELSYGEGSMPALDSVLKLAQHIGEADIAIEASRRMIRRDSVGSVVAHWGRLASIGRSPEARAEIERQPSTVREHPSVLYLCGAAATEWGRFEEAEDFFRRALAKAPDLAPAWLGLSLIKPFEPDDPDLVAMQAIETRLPSPEAQAMLSYAVGKAREDGGDIDAAFDAYARGAAIRASQQPFDAQAYSRFADEIIAGFNPEAIARLTPSRAEEQRCLFVTGLPRSGTTLTEQILRGHSAVVDGAEVNLFGAAMLPTLGMRFANALEYQVRSRHADPWGEIGRDYLRLIDKRFPAPGLVVDKSLGQSRLVGLMLHALPEARIAWLRRSPDDVALSCFRTHFDSGFEWTWSLADIADYMRVEDRLFEHWRSVFPDRILEVPYEEMVRSPASWAERLQDHFGLERQRGIETLQGADRSVNTASVSQVREPITTRRIGQAVAFERHLRPFRERYYR